MNTLEFSAALLLIHRIYKQGNTLLWSYKIRTETLTRMWLHAYILIAILQLHSNAIVCYSTSTCGVFPSSSTIAKPKECQISLPTHA